ncbi:MAG: hypothetical protein ABR543_15470 [Gemmatimonadaceae bacterium]
MRSLETAIVSRKTPGDGKLEISLETATAIGMDRQGLTVALSGSAGSAQVSSVLCGCGRADGAKSAKHVHYFLMCDLLRSLKPDERVSVLLDDVSRDVTIELE